MTTIGSKRGKYRMWSKTEDERLFAFVREHGEGSLDIIAAELGRSVNGVLIRLHRHGPANMLRTRQHRFSPDLTPAQIAKAKAIRATGYRGTMDLRKIAKIMGVRLVQLNRVFRPHEVERTRYCSGARNYVTNESITVPPEVLIERDYAMARPVDVPRELLGDPPPGRSALDRIRAGLPV